jgi:hypothetical protein
VEIIRRGRKKKELTLFAALKKSIGCGSSPRHDMA